MRNYTKLCETMRNYCILLLYFHYCMFTHVCLLLYFYYCILLLYFSILLGPAQDPRPPNPIGQRVSTGFGHGPAREHLAKGPGPDRLGFGLGGQGSWAGPAWFWPGGQESWAGPAWVWLGGPRVLGRTGLVWLGGPRVLGRTK